MEKIRGIIMSRNFRLRPLSGDGDSSREESRLIDRRDFLRYSFNTAAGGITLASLGSIGFASLLMGQADSDGGDTAVRFWVPTGAEDTVWYGERHLEPMSYDAFVQAATSSNTGMAGAQGVWSGMPVNVVYVPHEENKNSAAATNKPRFQYLDGYSSGGKYVGSGFEVDEKDQNIPHYLFTIISLLYSLDALICVVYLVGN